MHFGRAACTALVAASCVVCAAIGAHLEACGVEKPWAVAWVCALIVEETAVLVLLMTGRGERMLTDDLARKLIAVNHPRSVERAVKMLDREGFRIYDQENAMFIAREARSGMEGIFAIEPDPLEPGGMAVVPFFVPTV